MKRPAIFALLLALPLRADPPPPDRSSGPGRAGGVGGRQLAGDVTALGQPQTFTVVPLEQR